MCVCAHVHTPVHSSFSSNSTLSIAIEVPLNGLIYKSFQRESIVYKVQTPYKALLNLFYTLQPSASLISSLKVNKLQ